MRAQQNKTKLIPKDSSASAACAACASPARGRDRCYFNNVKRWKNSTVAVARPTALPSRRSAFVAGARAPASRSPRNPRATSSGRSTPSNQKHPPFAFVSSQIQWVCINCAELHANSVPPNPTASRSRKAGSQVGGSVGAISRDHAHATIK